MSPRMFKATGASKVWAITLLLLLVASSTAFVARASAAGSAAWTITSNSGPTIFIPGGNAEFVVTAINTGDASANGVLKIEDTLPEGFTATEVIGVDQFAGQEELVCTVSPVVCEDVGETPPTPGDSLTVTIRGSVSEALTEGTIVNQASVSEGEVVKATTSSPTAVGSTEAPFGISSFKTVMSNSQAGGHPNLTTAFSLNQRAPSEPSGAPRDIDFNLPPGVIGDPTATPQCPLFNLLKRTCPESAAVGVATALVAAPGRFETFSQTALVYNIPPTPGYPGSFAFEIAGQATIRLDANVRADGDYGVHVTIHDVNEASPVVATSVTLWGVPADHNGVGPNFAELNTVLHQLVRFGKPGSGTRRPFLTNSQVCSGNPLTADLTTLRTELSSSHWETATSSSAPAPRVTATDSLPTPTGCGLTSTLFRPTISVSPSTFQAGAPAGYEVDVHVPQNGDPDGLATPELQNAVVTLPLGVVLSPSAADGLQACSEAQIGLHTLGSPSCPAASKVGTVEVDTPLLLKPLKGSVYLAKQGENPFGSLFALYLVAEGSGVVVKLAGEVQADGTTGQLTTTFKNNPQVPFNDLRLQLNDGSRAPLVNPTNCGAATTTAQLTPYSSPVPATPSSSFEVDGCSPPRFAPSFVAGTSANQAGGFGSFALTLRRTDQDEQLSGLSVQMPPGLLGVLKNVGRCPEPQASEGKCGSDSLLGHVTTGAGAGPSPFYLGGQVFLTGPYKGAPFGLSVVVPAIAGPFDLGLVVVRAAIDVDPTDSHIVVTSDPLPTILDGVPLQLRTVNVAVDRPNFIFNPTSCDPLAVTGTIASTRGTTVPVSSRYQATECGSLAFKPTFAASSAAKTSRANGASLDVKVGYPKGRQANIRAVYVQLPKQLPSRLTTIQHACRDSVFDVNPAACDPKSLIGIVKARTPVLAASLSGPVYLVSHGGAAFPDIVAIIQGEGIRVDLTGAIDISKKGITSSNFAHVPDVPISAFELTLPEGPHSALTTALPAKSTLCTAKSLVMPTLITGQDNAQIKQHTKIKITGCPHKRAAKKAKKHT